MALTDTALSRLKAKNKPCNINDANGLSIHVAVNGTKNWHFRFSWQGKQPRISLGVYPIVSLKDARATRDQMLTLIANGIDPRTQKNGLNVATDGTGENEETSVTLAEFIPEWQKIKYLKLGAVDPNRKNSTQSQIERYLALDILPLLGKIPLNKITRPDVLKVLRKMEERGAFTPAEKVRCWRNKTSKLGMKGKHAPHSLRYAYAKDAIAYYQEQGFSMKEVMAKVSTDLGHGDGQIRHFIMLMVSRLRGYGLS